VETETPDLTEFFEAEPAASCSVDAENIGDMCASAELAELAFAAVFVVAGLSSAAEASQTQQWMFVESDEVTAGSGEASNPVAETPLGSEED
jgi:hypothetical protein